ESSHQYHFGLRQRLPDFLPYHHLHYDHSPYGHHHYLRFPHHHYQYHHQYLYQLSPSSPTSPIRPLGYRAAMIRLRAEAASTSYSLPLPPHLSYPPTPDQMHHH
ncbi:hypothetical protein Tco_0501600, partial [Tanacetum coccineum]